MTDHIGEAQRFAVIAGHNRNATPLTTSVVIANLHAAIALAEATTEVAKQARIANLIQVGNGRREVFDLALQGNQIIDGSVELSLDELETQMNEVVHLVREGLGLK